MTQSAAVLGADGPLGGELIRLLDSHPGLEPSYIGSVASAGAEVGSIHPHLTGLDRLVSPVDVNLMPAVDLAFLNLAEGEAHKAAEQVLERGVKVIDLGREHLFAGHPAGPSALRQQPASSPFLSDPAPGAWLYGLPEFSDVQLAVADRLAAPGAVATAVALSVVPALNEGLIDPDPLLVTVHGLAGDGADRAEIEVALESFTGATVAVHLGWDGTRSRLMRTVVHTGGESPNAGEIAEVTAAAFTRSVTVGQGGKWMLGSVRSSIEVGVDQSTSIATISAWIDAVSRRAGQAVWAANLMLGRDEWEGVPVAGLGGVE